MARVTYPEFPEMSRFGMPGYPEYPAPPLGGGTSGRDRDRAVVPNCWRPSTKPSWIDAPAWANWLAMDASGIWHWFQHQPSCASRHFHAVGGFSQIAGRSPRPQSWAPYLEAAPLGQVSLRASAPAITTQGQRT